MEPQNNLQKTATPKLPQIHQRSIIQKLPIEAQRSVELHLTTKPVLKYRPDDFQKLDLWLIAMSMFVGITPAPDETLRLMIINFINKSYKDMSKEEMDDAINMAISGKLGIEEKNLVHYNQLSSTWLGRIFNAYKAYRTKHMIEFSRNEQKYLLEESTKISDEEADKIMYNGLVEHYDKYCAGQLWYDINGVCYDFAIRKEIFKRPTEEFYNHIKSKAEQFVKADLSAKAFKADSLSKAKEIKSVIESIKSGASDNGEHAQVIICTKNMLLRENFAKLQLLNKHIKELFSDKL